MTAEEKQPADSEQSAKDREVPGGPGATPNTTEGRGAALEEGEEA